MLKCINNKPLEGNDIGPPLVLEQEYEVENVYQCSCGQDHYDVGLVSKYNWVSCYKCNEKIPKGDSIHWCHPNRFK